MKNALLLFTLLGLLTCSYSQSIPLWSEDFNAGLANYYSGYPTLKTEADTITVTGRKNTPTGQKLFIVKYDLNGDTIATMAYGGDSVSINSIIDYKFDSANHIYILHKEQLGFYKSKIVLQKYSLDGTFHWVQQIQNVGDTSYTPHSLGLINDTCLFVTSYKEYDYPEPGDDVISTVSNAYLYCFNSNGLPMWQREFDPATEVNIFTYEIFIHDNMAFLFSSNYASYYCLIKIDPNNNMTININTGIVGGIKNLQLTPDSNLILSAGLSYRLTKINLSGSVIWTRSYGTNLPPNVSGDEIKSLIQDASGNIYVTGRHYGANYGTPSYTNSDIRTMKCNSSGVNIWENRYAFGINNGDFGNTIKLKNGNIYVGGESQRLGIGSDLDYVVIRIDSTTGITNGLYRYDGIMSGNDAVTSLSIFDNGNVALTGLSSGSGLYDWTTQLISDAILNVTNIEDNSKISVYPNPVGNGQSLKIDGAKFKNYILVSSIGTECSAGSFSNGSGQSIEIEKIRSGIYLLILRNEDMSITKKIIIY